MSLLLKNLAVQAQVPEPRRRAPPDSSARVPRNAPAARALLLAGGIVISCGVGAQQAQGQGGERGPSTEQPVLTPAQSARLAETDAVQRAIVKNDAAEVKRLLARGIKPDFDFNEAYRGRSGESPLTMALHRNRVEIVRLLLEAGADPNRRDGFGKLPIHRASSDAALALLTQHGADAAAADRAVLAGPPPAQALWNLIDRADDAEAAKLLIAKGADPGALLGRETLLERALFRRRWRIARVLADAGASLHPADAPGCQRETWQCHSVQAARLATLDAPTLAHLKARGLDLDRVAANGQTALASLLLDPPPMGMVALKPDGGRGPSIEPASELSRIRTLLDAGADPNRQYRGFTPLMLAVGVPGKPRALADAIFAAGGRAEYDHTIAKAAPEVRPLAAPLPAEAGLAIAMLSQPPVFDYTGLLKGRTVGPLTWLVLYRRADLAARVLEREQTVPAADRYLLYFAGMQGEWELVLAALPYVREVDAGDRAGVTPLLMAAEDGRVAAVQALVARGADVEARSDRDWPPIWETPPSMWFPGHGPSKPRLVGGYTPLGIAQERGRDEVVRILRQAGAKQ